MGEQTSTTEELLPPEITPEQIQKLIAESEGNGATSCKVVTKGGQQFLVCEWGPLGKS